MFQRVEALVVFVRDLDTCRTFYEDIIGLQAGESDSHSAGFFIGGQYFLLLEISTAAQMISEEALDLRIEAGPRGLLAAAVEDVDATYAALKARGVTFLRAPIDQPWGRRTAFFVDPEGNVWEINQLIGSKQEG